MTIHEEARMKDQRVSDYLRRKGLDGLILSRVDNFAWFTCGGQNHVSVSAEGGVGSVLFLLGHRFLLANNIEAHRLLDEETGKVKHQVISWPWHDDGKRDEIVGKLIANRRVVSDDGMLGTPRLERDFVELRYSLTDAEIARYRALGRDCSAAMEDACAQIKKGQKECEIAGAVSRAFMDYNIHPTVVLIAADERISKYRHPIFTDKKVKKYVMVVKCGRRHGLILSLTRLVHFGKLSKELCRKHEAVCAVDAAYILSSTVGACVADVLKNGVQVYRERGYADEWQLHHQGGPTGYAGRDYKATPTESRRIVPNQALAWNPSITGTKSEDTILVKSEIRNPKFEIPCELLSQPSKKWPTLLAEYKGQKIRRADILVL
jgi:Xaa-Pro aminopeptidase